MQYLKDLIKQNGHKLVHYTEGKFGHEYESVFYYSSRHGGTIDGFRYYNDYIVDVTPKHENQEHKTKGAL